MRTHLGLAFLLLVAACGGDDDDSGGTQIDAAPDDVDAAADIDAASQDGSTGEVDASSELYPVQRVVPACSPTQSPGIDILLGDEPTGGNACGVNDSLPWVELELWTDEVDAPVTINFAPTEAMGRGAYCPGGDAPCREYDTGSITFDTFETGVGSSGSWELIGAGLNLSGRFDASWCDPDPPPDCTVD